MSFQDEPVNVKIKFYNEANVFKKVKNELFYRTNGKLYEKDDFLYYEDTIYGISKFKNWLLRFGSSAIVLEPESLRSQMIEYYKNKLDIYNSDNN